MRILRKINKDEIKSMNYKNEYTFHYVRENNLTYLCMSDAEYKYDIAFKFLSDIKKELY